MKRFEYECPITMRGFFDRNIAIILKYYNSILNNYTLLHFLLDNFAIMMIKIIEQFLNFPKMAYILCAKVTTQIFITGEIPL